MTHKRKGLVVGSPDKIVAACRQKVRRVLDNPAYDFAQITAGRNGYFYSLTGPKATEAKADRDYKVVPFIETDLYPYWIALILKFVPIKAQFRLSDISIILFRGPATDEAKEPLLRAEWGCTTTYDNENHAQPHWHAYPEGRESFLLSRDQLNLADQVLEFGTDTKSNHMQLEGEVLRENFSRLHLAMAARWHDKKDTGHRSELSEEGVPEWIEGCLLYIKDQLIYVFN